MFNKTKKKLNKINISARDLSTTDLKASFYMGFTCFRGRRKMKLFFGIAKRNDGYIIRLFNILSPAIKFAFYHMLLFRKGKSDVFFKGFQESSETEFLVSVSAKLILESICKQVDRAILFQL
jgi:hypothetical protein